MKNALKMTKAIKLVLELMDSGEEAAVLDVVALVTEDVGCSNQVVYSAIQALIAVELLDSVRIGTSLYIVASPNED